jgi:hypothetical protein
MVNLEQYFDSEAKEKFMGITQSQLDEFHQFAIGRLSSESVEVQLDELLLQWYDSKDKDGINATIREGLADIEKGLGKPASVLASELRTKFGITSE